MTWILCARAKRRGVLQAEPPDRFPENLFHISLRETLDSTALFVVHPLSTSKSWPQPAFLPSEITRPTPPTPPP